eukprot:scaffold653456_cov59-Prasinocladus_malaysianus.AAC.1
MFGQALHDQLDKFSGVPLRDCPVPHDAGGVGLVFSKEGWGGCVQHGQLLIRHVMDSPVTEI